MTAAPYEKLAKSIPVTVVTGAASALPIIPGAALIRIEPSGHDHAAGTECLACAARGDVRVLLFDLLERARQGLVPPFVAVVIDARLAENGEAIVDRLVPGRQPAFGLRDHTVARSFHLA